MQTIFPLVFPLLQFHKIVILIHMRLFRILVYITDNPLVGDGVGIILAAPVGACTVQTVLVLPAQLLLLDVYLQLHGVHDARIHLVEEDVQVDLLLREDLGRDGDDLLVDLGEVKIHQ